MDTLDIGKSDGIKSIPTYFSGGKKEEEEEDIPDMDTYEDTGDNLVGRSQFSILGMARKADEVSDSSFVFLSVLIAGCC